MKKTIHSGASVAALAVPNMQFCGEGDNAEGCLVGVGMKMDF